jgi:predicted nucleotidyltransferase component of viral defense system
MNPAYVQTVNLLLDIAPTVFQTPRFAMKGGTALNLFVQDLPRLSLDIDVLKMYESNGLTQEILDCFVAYLAGHNRPVHEV